MDNNVDRLERTLYVANMAEGVDEEMLYDTFVEAGPIEKVILKEDNNGCPQHALIIFKYTESVVWSLNNLNYWVLAGQQISIRPLRESSHSAMMDSGHYNASRSHHHQQLPPQAQSPGMSNACGFRPPINPYLLPAHNSAAPPPPMFYGGRGVPHSNMSMPPRMPQPPAMNNIRWMGPPDHQMTFGPPGGLMMPGHLHGPMFGGAHSMVRPGGKRYKHY